MAFSLLADLGHDTGLRTAVNDNGFGLFCELCNNAHGFTHGKLIQPADSARATHKHNYTIRMWDLQLIKSGLDFGCISNIHCSGCAAFQGNLSCDHRSLLSMGFGN